ncbi:TetR/AcrR family transcriptional regulator [Iamia majanohamensis]|uniref:TetR/AcrR family transcriptional regulator n=1 Tax=Iamia majanohamensis TaxID=467976 RepID=A0AAF0BXG8_9ACTN|nr:TetR/AcrR family transcriptional regulator [Iamia majanohamensis]WCO68709.1 TetR/AcrR family transcriptional regulator [Iamia majanohamensis]
MALAAENLPSAPDAPAVPASDDPLGDRLLEAAAEVFAERGYDRAGVAEIARRAGVTTGAIYSRHAGKAGLLVAALECCATDELDSLFADHRFQGRAEDVLAIAGSHLVRRSSDADRSSALLTEAFIAARRDPAVADLIRSHVLDRRDRLRDIIEAAKASGGIGADLDTEALATFCHALGFGFLLLEAAEVPLPSAPPWEQLIAHLIAALGAEPSIDLTTPPTSPQEP